LEGGERGKQKGIVKKKAERPICLHIRAGKLDGYKVKGHKPIVAAKTQDRSTKQNCTERKKVDHPHEKKKD
jgi:hypothetical protein